MPILATLAAALFGAVALESLKVPAGALIGAMVGVASLNLLSDMTWPMPRGAEFLAFAAIGWLLGQSITKESLRMIARSPGLILGTVAFLLVVCGTLAFVLASTGRLDPATAYLATSPGGLSQMGALAAAVQAQAPLVVTLHLVRVLAVVGFAPLIIRLLPST